MKSIVLAVLLTVPAFAATEPFIHAEVVVDAPADAVWSAWTTVEGVKSWFAPGARIEPKVGGAYEIFFAPDQPEGQRGADGMRILLFQPKSALAFTWNAPASFGERRDQLTHVIVRLYPLSDKQTRVTLTHSGFGLGAEWEAVRAYFDSAWSTVVLPRLQARFAKK